MFTLLKSYFANTFNFSGRISRKDYWLTMLAVLICMIVSGFILALILLVLDIKSYGSIDNTAILDYLIIFPLLIPSFALEFRRLHDINWSGCLVGVSFVYFLFGVVDELCLGIVDQKFYFIEFFKGNYSLLSVLDTIMLAVGIFIFLLMMFKGTATANKYGEVPTPIYKKK